MIQAEHQNWIIIQTICTSWKLFTCKFACELQRECWRIYYIIKTIRKSYSSAGGIGTGSSKHKPKRIKSAQKSTKKRRLKQL